MKLTRSVPPSPPLLSEERHRARGGITSPVPSDRVTTSTSTTRSKRTYSPVKNAIARHRQVAPVDTRIARGKLLSGSGKTPENLGKFSSPSLRANRRNQRRDFDPLSRIPAAVSATRNRWILQEPLRRTPRQGNTHARTHARELFHRVLHTTVEATRRIDERVVRLAPLAVPSLFLSLSLPTRTPFAPSASSLAPTSDSLALDDERPYTSTRTRKKRASIDYGFTIETMEPVQRSVLLDGRRRLGDLEPHPRKDVVSREGRPGGRTVERWERRRWRHGALVPTARLPGIERTPSSFRTTGCSSSCCC